MGPAQSSLNMCPEAPPPAQPTGESSGLRTSSSLTSVEVPATRCPSPGGSSRNRLGPKFESQTTDFLGWEVWEVTGQGEWPHVCPDERQSTWQTFGGCFPVAG